MCVCLWTDGCKAKPQKTHIEQQSVSSSSVVTSNKPHVSFLLLFMEVAPRGRGWRVQGWRQAETVGFTSSSTVYSTNSSPNSSCWRKMISCFQSDGFTSGKLTGLSEALTHCNTFHLFLDAVFMWVALCDMAAVLKAFAVCQKVRCIFFPLSSVRWTATELDYTPRLSLYFFISTW